MPPKRQAAEPAASEASVKKPKTTSKSVVCPVPGCGKTFALQTSANIHKRTVHDGVRYPCEVLNCGKTFTQQSSLNLHKRTAHEGVKHVCEVENCGQEFSHKDSLTKHVKSVHNGVQYPCKVLNCDKVFAGPSGLNQHMRSSHDGVKYSCEVLNCGKSFKDPSGLAYHNKAVHNGVTYPCEAENCSKAFTSQSSLRLHERTLHGGEKHTCEFLNCGKVYTQKNTLKRHIQTAHHGFRYYCPYDDCLSTATTTGDMTTHINAFHRGVLQCCPFKYCQKAYTTKNNLKIHLKSVHASPEEAAERLEQRLELQRFLADKETKGLCSASKSCENPASQDSFHCYHHQKSKNIITSVLEERRAAGKLSASSIKSSDEFALLLQRTKISLDPATKESLHLLASGSSDTFLGDTEFIWVGRFLPLDLTIMRANGEEIISTRVDYNMSTEDLRALCPHPISRACVRKVYGNASSTWGKTPQQIIKILQEARISSGARF